MSSSSNLGVTPAGSVTNSAFLGYNQVFSSQTNAVSIGGLSQNQTDLSVSSQLSQNVPNDYFNFNFESGSAIKLGFNSLSNTQGGTIPFASDLRVQVLNSAGTVIADSDGTPDQQTAYSQLTSSSGLAASNGTYSVKVSYLPGTPIYNQAYNFQLYSGTTYSNTFTTTALIQSYDPNLFVSASSVVTPSSNLSVYTKTANLTANNASSPISIGQLNPGTELSATTLANTQSPDSTYGFNVGQSGAISLNLNNTSITKAQLDVQLIDSQGNVVADNNGTQAQQNAYTELTSGAGLQAAAGQYTLNVGYAAGQDTNNAQTYNFQLNEGMVYNQVYSTSVIQKTNNNYSVGSNLNVYADEQAQLFTRQEFNQIKATAASAINIGWLDKNVSSLAVSSELTSVDSADYYNFTLQQGNNFKLAFNNLTDSSALHVQVLDSSGLGVVADNQGTSAQQAAFAALTSDSGLNASPGQYIVKVSYANGASKSSNEVYGFQLYSGDSYTSLDKTTASPQTLQNLLLSGGSQGYTPTSESASLLTDLSNGTTISLFNSSLFSTNVFA